MTKKTIKRQVFFKNYSYLPHFGALRRLLGGLYRGIDYSLTHILPELMSSALSANRSFTYGNHGMIPLRKLCKLV